ncbi:unnamed protein product [Rotaria sp. Silwood2]|nr:unnamed protein product [Rotaria sp. Silwood2]CAF3111999.1 unnamed protein product [Rotaria sp. Silwood2]CAF3195682.1 unnamed protein product [Rotaria sp. Silwood2]CAF3343154.1 unnamed protein product [Rotaria sp. Silwood2]CAF4303931.1 unnamed protein product [Rotaria sp. Silwood2]
MLRINAINVKEYETATKLFEMVPGDVDCSLQAASFNYSKPLFYKNERFPQSKTDGDILTEMITCTRKSGTITMTGNYNNAVSHISIGQMMGKN